MRRSREQARGLHRRCQRGRTGVQGEVGPAHLDGHSAARQLVRPQPRRHRVGETHDLAANHRRIRHIELERLFVADGLGHTAGLHRTVVDATCQAGQVRAAGGPDEVRQPLQRHVCQVAHAGHADGAELLQRCGADAPQRLDWVCPQEVELFGDRHHSHAEPRLRTVGSGHRLGGFRRELGQRLGGRHADRAIQPRFVADGPAQVPRDLRRSAEQTAGAGDVQERLIERDGLHVRRDRLEDVGDGL